MFDFGGKMVFKEKVLSSERIYEGRIINIRKDKVTVINGTSYREVVEHSGGAVLLAVTDDRKMVMVRQYRRPADKVMFEVPAGKIDGDAAVKERVKLQTIFMEELGEGFPVKIIQVQYAQLALISRNGI